jgi:membrane protein DedA with SNARE-associated domain
MEDLLNQLSKLDPLQIYLSLFVILAFLGLLIPEDIPLLTAGFLAYLGGVYLPLVILLAYVAVLIGDSVIFLIGRHWGLSILGHRWVGRFLPEYRIERVRHYFTKYGDRTIFLARFIVGLRAATFWAAGTLKVPYRTFITFDGLAALVSVPLFILIGWYFGDDIERGMLHLARVETTLLYLVVAAAAVLLALEYWRRRALAKKISRF